MADLQQVLQLDRAFIKGSIEKTPEGFLVIEAVITRPGVFTYMVGGKPTKRYCPPDVVFDEKSYNTLKLKPVIAGHPYMEPGNVITPENVKEWEKGSVGETIYRSGDDLMCKFTVKEKTAIEQIENKELAELSCGYLVQVDNTPGYTPDGVPYDSVQTARPMYNHISLERSGRVGNAIIPALDSGEEVRGVSFDNEETQKSSNIGVNSNMATITENGVSYEVPDNFVPVFQGLKTALDASETIAETNKGTIDTLTSKVTLLGEDLKKAQEVALDSSEITKKAQELAGTYTEALKVGLDAKDIEGLDIALTQKKVCEKLVPGIALDSASESYIAGVYATAMSQFTAPAAIQREKVKAAPVQTGLDAAEGDPAKQARAGMYETKGAK